MPPLVDPNHELKYVLEGRIVTMDDTLKVMEKGRVWVSGGEIVAVTEIGEDLPDGFSSGDIIKIGGTLYPGMIELHNHLPYKSAVRPRQYPGIGAKCRDGKRSRCIGRRRRTTQFRRMGVNPGFPRRYR